MAQVATHEIAEIVTIPLSRIRSSVFQTRISLENIDPLSKSISEMGLINPVLVRPISSKEYEAISGHRRMEACKTLGLTKIPCVVRVASDKEAYLLSLSENLERETMDPVEEAEAFRRYVCEYGWGSISELAGRLGRSEEFISQRILMLNLPPEVIDKIRKQALTQSHAEELVWIKNSELQIELAQQIVKKRLSVSETHKVAKLVKEGSELGQALEIVQTSDEVFTPDFLRVHSQKRNRNSSRIKKAIVSLRTSLSVLDLIIEEITEDDANNESERIEKIMRKSRYNLHQVIDELVKEKVGLEKIQSKIKQN